MRVNVGALVGTTGETTPHPALSPEGRGVAIVDLSRPAAPREVGYGELDAGCNAVAAGLVARGVGRGDRVGILALNRTEYIEALYGTMRAGAIPVPLNIKLPAEGLAFIARDADLKLVFVDAGHRKVVPPDVPAVDFDADYAQFLKPGPFTAVEPGPDGKKREEFFAQFSADIERYLQLYPEIKVPPHQLRDLLGDQMGCLLGAKIAERLRKRVGDRLVLRSTIWTQANGSPAAAFAPTTAADRRDLCRRLDNLAA